MKTALPIFRCPSDPAPDLNTFRLDRGTDQFALSNYRAVCGTDSSGALLRQRGPQRDHVAEQQGDVHRRDRRDEQHGVIGECVFEQDKTKRKWAAIWAGHTGYYCSPDSTIGCGVRISDNMWHLDNLSAQINGTAPRRSAAGTAAGRTSGSATGRSGSSSRAPTRQRSSGSGAGTTGG